MPNVVIKGMKSSRLITGGFHSAPYERFDYMVLQIGHGRDTLKVCHANNERSISHSRTTLNIPKGD